MSRQNLITALRDVLASLTQKIRRDGPSGPRQPNAENEFNKPRRLSGPPFYW